MSDKKYGWEICDEVQRFVSNTADIQFVPLSAYQALERKLAIAVVALESICGCRCAQGLNPCEAREALEQIAG